MAFSNFGSLVPYGGPVQRREILANSTTFAVLDAIEVDTDGFLSLGTAGAGFFGFLLAIGTNKGVGVNTTGVAGAEMGSFVGTYLTASDNETVGFVRGDVDISQNSLYLGDPATGTFGTTTGGSGQLSVYFDLSDEKLIDETSVVDTTAQVHSWGLDPEGANKIVFNIFESNVFTLV